MKLEISADGLAPNRDKGCIDALSRVLTACEIPHHVETEDYARLVLEIESAETGGTDALSFKMPGMKLCVSVEPVHLCDPCWKDITGGN
jgi:hypothetical protein